MFTRTLGDDAELRLLEARQANLLFALVDGNRPHLRRFLPWVDHTRTVEDSRAFIELTLRQLAQSNGFHAGIWSQGELAGVIGHHRIDWSNGATTLGYWLGERFQGKGLMTRAVEAFLHHAFVEVKLNRLEIRCAVENDRSRAIPERLGFKPEGVLRDAEWLYDHYVDHVIYGQLAREYHARAAR
jgi:ribosomal-protein-serine acetyltransferase